MANARSDVQLIISARDEATRAIEAVNAALLTLNESQTTTAGTAGGLGSNLLQVAEAAAALETAYGKIDNAAGRGEAAFGRQQSTLEATKSQLASVVAQIEAAEGAIGSLQGKIVDTKVVGGDTAPLVAQLRLAESAQTALQQQQAKLTASVEGQQAAIGRSTNSLQQLGSVANAAEAALLGVGDAVQREMLQAEAATERTTAALREQAAVARAEANDRGAVAANNQFFNVTANPNGAQARQSAAAGLADLLAQQVATEEAAVRAAAATEKEAQALRDLAAAAKESAAQDEAQQRASAFLGVTANPNGAQASQSAAVFEEQQRLADAAERLRAQIDPLAAVQADLNAKLEAARDLYRNGAISADELAAAERVLGLAAQSASDHLTRIGKGANGAPSLFGLKPYELQNLSYQINDVVSGFASGIPASQILAQQGGQILQIFPKAGAAIIAALSNPVILGAIAAFALLAVAIAHVHAEAVRLRDMEGLVASLGDGADYSAKNLSAAAEKLQLLGVAADKASASVSLLAREGIAPDKIDAFALAARNASLVLGTDLPSATKQMVDAFKGGEDGVLKLQDATHFLSDVQVKNIRDLYEHGKAAEAATLAFHLFDERMKEAADTMRGKLGQSADSLGVSWDALLDKIGNTAPIKDAASAFGKMAEAVGYLLDRSNGTRSKEVVGVELTNLLADAQKTQEVIAGLTASGPPKGAEIGLVKSLQAQLLDIQTKIAATKREFAGLVDPPVGGNRPLAAIDADIKRVGESAKSVAAQIKAVTPDERATSVGTTRLNNLGKTLTNLEGQYKSLTAERAKALNPGEALTASDKQALDAANRELGLTREQADADAASARAYTSAQKAAADANQVRLAGERAYRDEIKKTGDAVIAAARRAGAEQQKSLQFRLQREKEFAGQPETDRRAALVSSAQGFAGKSETNPQDRAALEQLFKIANINLDPAKLAWCAAFINGILASNGLPTSAPKGSPDNNRARSFLNYGTETSDPQVGDIVVLRRGKGNAEGHVGFFQGFDQNGNPRVLGGNQGNKVGTESVNKNDVLSYRRVPGVGETAGQQEAYNKALDVSNAALKLQVDQAQKAVGLSGEQLLAEQRRQVIETAIATAERSAQEKGLTLDKTRKDAITDLIGKQFDLAHAQEEATIGVTQAQAERQALLDRLQAAQTDGNTALVTKLRGQLDVVNKSLADGIDKAEAYWKQFDTPEARAAITNLEALRAGIGRTNQDITLTNLQSPVDQLGARRSAGLDQVQALRDEGQTRAAAALREQVVGLDKDLLKAIDDLIAFWSTSSRPEAAATVASLQNMRAQIVSTHQEFRITAGDIQQAFAGDLVSAFDQFAQSVGEGKNVFASLGRAALSFAASFLRDIATMMLKILALKLAMKLGFGGAASGLTSLLNGGGLSASAAPLTAAGATLNTAGITLGAAAAPLAVVAASLMAAAIQMQIAAATSSLSSGFGASFSAASSFSPFAGGAGGIFAALHSGGIAGSATLSRGGVWPGVFAGAARFHTGGLPGLRSNEVPTILERGEEVLTRGDSRHVLNGGGKSGKAAAAPTLLRQTLVFDPGEIARSQTGRAGEQTFMTHLRANKDTIRQELNLK